MFEGFLERIWTIPSAVPMREPSAWSSGTDPYRASAETPPRKRTPIWDRKQTEKPQLSRTVPVSETDPRDRPAREVDSKQQREQ